MKSVVFNGKRYFYKVYETLNILGYSEYETVFFREEEIIRKRKWWIFGEWYEKKVPKVIFSIPANAEDPLLSKSFWMAAIDSQISLLERKKELKEGKLI